MAVKRLTLRYNTTQPRAKLALALRVLLFVAVCHSQVTFQKGNQKGQKTSTDSHV